MKKVLVLDDEKELLDQWRWHFRMWGEEVEIFTGLNGAEGIELVKAHGKFDLMITDFHMPEMDGLGFINYVRTHDTQTPIFLFSTLLPEQASISTSIENLLFFEKPVIGEKLRSYIQKYLSGDWVYE